MALPPKPRAWTRWQILAWLLLVFAIAPAIWVAVRPNKKSRMPPPKSVNERPVNP